MLNGTVSNGGMIRKQHVLSISVPDEALPGEEVVAEAASGEHVVFTLPKGVAPGTRLQMVPTRQVMQRGETGGPIVRVTPVHPMANGLNVLANSNALYIRGTSRRFLRPARLGKRWGRSFLVHAQQSDGLSQKIADRHQEEGQLPVALVASETHDKCSLTRALCWPAHPFQLALFDEMENELATLERSSVCVFGDMLPGLAMSGSKITVHLVDGSVLGTVEQRTGPVCCSRSLEVHARGAARLRSAKQPLEVAGQQVEQDRTMCDSSTSFFSSHFPIACPGM